MIKFIFDKKIIEVPWGSSMPEIYEAMQSVRRNDEEARKYDPPITPGTSAKDFVSYELDKEWEIRYMHNVKDIKHNVH